MRIMHWQTAPRAGFALVFVLAMLVLALAIVLAYFSLTTLDSKIASASTAGMKVRLITQAAEGYVLDDFRQEIEAGSTSTNPSLTVQVQRPIVLTNVGIGVNNTWAPSVVPQRVGDAGITNIVKVSRSGLEFFTNGPGYTSSGLARASAIATTNASSNGKFLTRERWNLPKLMGETERSSFVAPDWIYLDRQGGTPTDFTDLAAMASTESTNHVIGRYAYVIYDVGGLIDINVVGNNLDEVNIPYDPYEDNSRRGRLHQVPLPGALPGINVFSNFVAWRSPISSTNGNSTAGGGGLFDPKRTFIDVPEREQAFVNRQDLLAYVASTNTITTYALPFLTTFSRDRNAPSHEPNAARSKLPATPVADEMNPGLLSVTFPADTILHRPEGNVTVTSGTPVMPRRFPLSKLSLFEKVRKLSEQANPDPAKMDYYRKAMSYYFGLVKVNSQTWTYNATTSDGRIARLGEIAAQGREPNFFEILQAVIYTGSLGKSAPDTFTFEDAEDKLQNLQVMQIGANIIDQADEADKPTGIEFPSGVPNDFFTVYGVENLPYISQIGVVGWRPPTNRDLFQAWAIFDVWNPHQNAWNGDLNVTKMPVGVDGFRILPISGRGRVSLSYYLELGTVPKTQSDLRDTLYGNTTASGGCLFISNQPLLTLNAGRTFTFSATGNYSEPTTLGNSTSSADTPGLLLAECTPGVAIPALADRDPAIARTTTLAALEGELGASFGVKAYNYFRLRSNSFPDDWRFALQAHYTGDPATTWHTYQVFEGLGGPGEQLDASNSPVGGEPRAAMGANTDHSVAGAPLQNEYYQWRSRGASIGMVKTDPRTNRLGFSGWGQASISTTGHDFLGYSARHSADPLPVSHLNDSGGGLINNDYRWAVPGGIRISGLIPNPSVQNKLFALAPGFELMPALSAFPPAQRNRFKAPLYGLVSNSPDALDASRPFRYSDPDEVVRPGDGYFGTLPTVPGRTADRPIILNRPFRSVGELGYVFRDLPWKTLDFSTRHSGDLGLLDVFSISETDGDPPLTAGQINLNTRQTAVLATVLQNSSKGVAASELSAAESQALAEAIVSESTLRPFTDKGDLVARVLNAGTGADPLAGDVLKAAREAAVRTLAEIGTIRTWNFLIDLVAQSGRFTPASQSGSDFVVQGEERVWIHVAIDRMTGEVLELRREVVNE